MKAHYLSLEALVAWKYLGGRPDWQALFGRSGPLVLEIGCGNGEALARRALAHPEENLVGLDLSWPSVRRTLRRVAQTGSKNVRVLQMGAEMALELLFAPESLGHVYALFPCPWPKDKHAVKRLLRGEVLDLLHSRLAPGGTVRLLTDDLAYMEWVCQEAGARPYLLNRRTVPPVVDTKYERKWRENGQEEFYELVLEKTAGPLPGPVPQDREIELHSRRIARMNPDNLTLFQESARGEEGVVACREIIRDREQDKILLRMLTVEDGLQQKFYVEVAPLEEGGYNVRVAPGSAVFPTVAVQRAMDLVAGKLGE